MKAAIYGLNRAGGRTRELEEAWIVHALVREDGMSQVEVAELLGRHKSWVCRQKSVTNRNGIGLSHRQFFSPTPDQHSLYRLSSGPPCRSDSR